jgi:hypothetical protein
MKPLVSLIPAPDRSTEARKALTKKQRAELALAQGGQCGCGCGGKLDHAGEGTVDEHLNPLGLTGTNDLSNRSIWRKPCSDRKTYGTDLPAIAKAKRIEARDTGARRERRPIPQRVDPWGQKGVRKFASRPFPVRPSNDDRNDR